MYALYDAYGFTKGEIGQLFIVGFGSSMIFGTIVGGFADKYGRKLNCVLFAILYSLSCITKHFNSFPILLLGRLLGGVATSILFSAFETWMVSEHKAAGHPEEWMTSTFTGMTFGSSLVAIVAGLLASTLASNFGLVAPFDASLLLLVIGGVLVWRQWRENYGEAVVVAGATPAIVTGFDNFGKAATLLRTNERVMLLGLIQSCFESAMYIFVFMWTPALEASAAASGGGGSLPHGVIFAAFMVAIMIGSKVFELAIVHTPVEQLARIVFGVSACTLAVPVLTSSHTLQLAAFFVFEACCGMYFPAAGTMRNRYIPEEVRATVMNVFRIGLNLIVVLTLVNIDSLSTDTVFIFCVVLMGVAAACQHRLIAVCAEAPAIVAEEDTKHVA